MACLFKSHKAECLSRSVPEGTLLRGLWFGGVGSIRTASLCFSHKAECLPRNVPEGTFLRSLGFVVMLALYFLIFASLLAYRKCHQSLHPPTVTLLREVVKGLMTLKFDIRDKKGGRAREGGTPALLHKSHYA